MRNLSAINKVKALLSRESLLKLYFSIFQSHLTYCIEVWGNCCKTYLLPIIKAQKMAVHIICNLKHREHTTFYFKELKILKFLDLVKFKILLLIFKAKNMEFPINLQELFCCYMSDNFDCITVHLHYHIENPSIEDTFIVPNLCKDRLLHFYIQIL